MEFLEAREIYIKKLVSVVQFTSTKSNWESGIRQYDCLAYILKGSNTHRFDTGRICQIKAGEIIFLPHGCTYNAVNNGSEELECIAIHFIMDIDTVFNPYVYTAQDDLNMLELFNSTMHTFLNDKINRHSVCMQNIYSIISILMEQSEASDKNAPLRVQLKPAMHLITERIADPLLSVEMLAGSIPMSRQYFCICFTKAYGTTPIDYIRLTRIRHAKNLLKGTYYPINVISEHIGFSNAYYFSRVFKQYTGMSPSEYRSKDINHMGC